MAATRFALVAAAALAALAGPPSPAADPPKRPNVLLVLADDLGAEAAGCYGGTTFDTPHIDALAKAGVRFENAYATPLCSPSRAQLLTGRYPFRTGIVEVTNNTRRKESRKLDVAEHTTLAKFLADAGYATGVAGKWHLCNDFADNPTHVADAGFRDRFLWRMEAGGKVVRHYWNPELWVDGKANAELGRGRFGDDLFCDHVIEFMRANKDKPFFAYYPMCLIHSQSATGKNYPPPPGELKPGADPDVMVKPRPATAADLVKYMDSLVGRLTAEVERLGIAGNTLIIFAGDNGTDPSLTATWNGRPVRGEKGRLTEAGTRVPLIVAGAGVAKPGRVVTDLVDFSDVLPTVLDACGVKLPNDYRVDGRSFAPQLRGEKGQPREWVYAHLRDAWFVRDPRWRLDSDGKLYDVTDRYDAKAAGGPDADAARRRLAAVANELHPK